MSVNDNSTTFRGPLKLRTLSNGGYTDTAVFDSSAKLVENSILSSSAAPIGTSSLRVAHAKYDFAVDGGAVSTITPVSTATIPANAIIVGGTINSTTAVTSSGSATVAVGTSAGSSSTALLAATAKASLSANAVLNAVPVFATPVKMSAAGSITFTVGTAALTAGVIEAFFLYYVAAA